MKLEKKSFCCVNNDGHDDSQDRERERMYIDYCTFFKLFVLILFSTSLCVLGAIPALRIDEKEITKVWVYYVFTYVRLGNSREGV